MKIKLLCHITDENGETISSLVRESTDCELKVAQSFASLIRMIDVSTDGCCSDFGVFSFLSDQFSFDREFDED